MSGSCNNSPPPDGKSLVVATTNDNKFFEIRSALGPSAVPLYTLNRFPRIKPPEETGATFMENARIKAEAYFHALQRPVLAEDSGLVVPALDGYPGIHSARIAETDPERIRIILEKLGPHMDRAAAYVCSMVFIVEGRLHEVEASCRGWIVKMPVGERGFGYDPIFQPEGSPKTFGQMSIKEKSNYSHRGKAAQLLIPHLLSEFRRPQTS